MARLGNLVGKSNRSELEKLLRVLVLRPAAKEERPLIGTWIRRDSRPVLLAVSVMFVAASTTLAAEQSHLGLNQRVLVIPVKFADVANTRMTGDQWVSRLNK